MEKDMENQTQFTRWGTDRYCILNSSGNEEQLSYDPSIKQKVQQFIDNLQCQTTKQLGIQKYWRKLKRIQTCCGMPCIVVQTFDGYKITFVVAKGMIKVSGLAHTLQNKANKKKKTECSQCLYKLSKLFRDTIIPGFGLPPNTLSSDQSLKGCYQSYLK